MQRIGTLSGAVQQTLACARLGVMTKFLGETVGLGCAALVHSYYMTVVGLRYYYHRSSAMTLGD